MIEQTAAYELGGWRSSPTPPRAFAATCDSPSGEPPGRAPVVEDELVATMELQAPPAEAGHEALAPHGLDVELPEAATPRAALLCLGPAGGGSAPVADAPRRRVPFLVVTGHGDARPGSPGRRDAPLIRRPGDLAQLPCRLSAAMA